MKTAFHDYTKTPTIGYSEVTKTRSVRFTV